MQKLVVPNAILLGEVERLVSEGNSVTLMPKGSSMLPFIRGGKDSVVLVAPGELHPGLIALAEVGEK